MHRHRPGSWSDWKPTPASLCASVPSMCRLAMMRPPCWRASRLKWRKPQSMTPSSISASLMLRRAHRRRIGSEKLRPGRLRSPRRASSRAKPPTHLASDEAGMIRIILFLASLAVIAAGVGWIADRPGEVSVTWMGYRIETSLMVAFFAVVALVVVLMTVWWIVSVILHSPEYASFFFKHRRVTKGYLAVTRGLIAIVFFFFNDTATTEIYTLSLHDALPISSTSARGSVSGRSRPRRMRSS